MSLRSLLFVSESLLRQPDDAACLQALVQACRERNAAHDLTGAMILARGHFAEILEGPAGAVAATMERIAGDPRHREVTVVLSRDIAERQFADSPMSLVYSGNSFYVDRHIAPLLQEDEAHAADRPVLAAQLHYLIRELAQANRR
jgi:hypothetical protein